MGRLTNVEIACRKALLEQGLKKCYRCSVVKTVDEFHTHNCNKLTGLSAACRQCHSRDPKRVEGNKRANDRNQQKFNNYKKTLECQLCGYNEDSTKLHFHHRDSSTKLYNIAHMANRGFSKTMLKEIAKCDVLCRPCHLKQHPHSSIKKT